MRYIIFLIIILSGVKSIGQNDCISCQNLSENQEILDSYIEMSIEELVVELDCQTAEVRPYEHIDGILNGVTIHLSEGGTNDCFLFILIDDFEFVEEVNMDRDWDIALLKKEKIRCLAIIENEFKIASSGTGGCDGIEYFPY